MLQALQQLQCPYDRSGIEDAYPQINGEASASNPRSVLGVLVLRRSFGGAGVRVVLVMLVGLSSSIGVTAGATLVMAVRPDRKCGPGSPVA